MDDSKPKKNNVKVDQTTAEFSIDGKTHGAIEVPSISKLLNRKSLNKAAKEKREGTGPKSPPKAQVSPPHSETKIDKKTTLPPQPHDITTVAPRAKEIPVETSKEAGLLVQPKTRRAAPMSPQLALWDSDTLRSSTDPLSQPLITLLQAGAQSILFLATQNLEKPKRIQLKSSAAVLAQTKLQIWTGLSWEPNQMPEVWNLIQNQGFVEFSPPGTVTVQSSHRNVLRAAFGIEQREWLYLIRVGPVDQIRGVLALVTNKNLTESIRSVLNLLGMSPKPNSTLPK